MNHPLYNLFMYLPLKNENILQSVTVVFLKKMTTELLLTSFPIGRLEIWNKAPQYLPFVFPHFFSIT